MDDDTRKRICNVVLHCAQEALGSGTVMTGPELLGRLAEDEGISFPGDAEVIAKTLVEAAYGQAMLACDFDAGRMIATAFIDEDGWPLLYVLDEDVTE